MTDNDKHTVGELFAGIGGIGLGFKQAGFNIIWANEIDRNAITTYISNFNHTVINMDIKLIDTDTVPDVDILTGGFPCQAFSIAGYQNGFDDDRGNIFFEILRFIRAKKPKVIFLENVKNLHSHNKGHTYKVIYESLTELEYHIKTAILNTYKYSNIPQNRERIYIVCFKDKRNFERFNFPTEHKTLLKIQNLLSEKVEEEFYYDNFKHIDILRKEMTDEDSIYQWRRIYARKNKSYLCPTLTANMGMGGHNVPLIKQNERIRKLTPRECARFQGFPEDFILPSKLTKSSLYKQIGNSVSIPVIQKIATQIKLALKK